MHFSTRSRTLLSWTLIAVTPLTGIAADQIVASTASQEVGGQTIPLRVRAGRSATTKANVTIARDGRIIQKTKTGVLGVAQLQGLAPGKYTVVVNGPQGFAAYSARMVPGYEMSANLVPTQDFAAAQKILQQRIAAGAVSQSVDARLQLASGQEIVDLDDLNLVNTGVLQRGTDGAVRLRIAGSDQDGTLRSVDGAAAYMIQSGNVVQEAKSNDSGVVSFADLTAGRYSMVAVSTAGIVAMAITIEESTVAQAPQDGVQFVVLEGGAPMGVVEAVPPVDFGVVSDACNDGCGPQGEFVGGGFDAGGMMSAAGAGGAGGGGLMGPLLLAGAAAGIAIAVADANDNNNKGAATPPAP